MNIGLVLVLLLTTAKPQAPACYHLWREWDPTDEFDSAYSSVIGPVIYWVKQLPDRTLLLEAHVPDSGGGVVIQKQHLKHNEDDHLIEQPPTWEVSKNGTVSEAPKNKRRNLFDQKFAARARCLWTDVQEEFRGFLGIGHKG